jgi:pantetheine-phosphate adenylyltransferase
MGKIAIYPGSFDPITNGHVDIIERGLKIFDKVIVSILNNPNKKSLFTVEERVDLIENSLKGVKNVSVKSFDGLLVDFAGQVNADVIIRGMRAVSDFDNEFHMAMMNRRLNRQIQTVFLMTGMRWVFTSSSGIKEVAAFGGSVAGIVPPYVEQKLKEKY